MGGTPFNHDDIVYYVERHIECVWGNYLNNVEHITYDTLQQQATGATDQCIQPPGGSERCFSYEESKERMDLIRKVLDVTQMIVSVTDIHEYTMTIASNASCVLAVPIGNFTINHEFEDYYVETIEFYADGAQKKDVHYTEDYLSDNLMDWASNVLAGHSDYLQLEYRMKHKDEFYQLDLKDTSTKAIILAVI